MLEYRELGTEISSERLTKAINHASGFLIRNIDREGEFNYRFNMNPSIRVQQKYNVLRHAGTLYSMCECYKHFPSAELQSSIERAAAFLTARTLGDVPEGKDCMAIWSPSELEGTDNPLQAKLGGTGLGLVALVGAEGVCPGLTSPEQLQGLGNFLEFMQKPDGEFYSKYIPAQGGRNARFKSLYYPGEAILGLLRLHAHFPDRDAGRQTAIRGLSYLADSNKKSNHYPIDHWTLLATAECIAHLNEAEYRRLVPSLMQHARQICMIMLRDQVRLPYYKSYVGSFQFDGRTTPTSTRLEGLIATLSYLPVGDILQKKIERAVTLGIQFLLRAQVGKGPYLGAFPRSISYRQPGLFTDRRASEVRIDYVQHALSALIACLQRGETA